MNALQPYPAYMDSGVEWLGDVPEHWRVRRVATVADLRVSNVDKHVREGESPVRLCNYLDVYHNERIGAHLPFMAGTATEREIRKFRLAVGDVLVTKDSEDWSDIGVPALVDYAAQDLVCGYHLAMLRPDGASLAGGYLFQALKDSHVAWQWQVAAAGVTRYGLSLNAIRSMRIPLPPLPEQTAIARFLDDADRRIRRYIRAKERLIELLEEERRATIHEAVTGRIDVRTGQPYPAYRDSGVEWLGEVPEHWEVRRLRRCVRAMGGMTPSMQTLAYWGGAIPWVTPKDMKKEAIGDSEIKVTQAALDSTSLRLVDSGRVLIVVRGMILAKRVPVAWTTDPVTINQDLKALTPVQGIAGEFLACALRSAQDVLRSFVEVAGHGTRRLPSERWRSLPIAIPPASEQAAIARFLAVAGRRLSARRAAIARQIDLLREYRTRLIADVVTGKLDVREAAAELPETDPFAVDRERPDTIPTESNPHSTERDMMKEALP